MDKQTNMLKQILELTDSMEEGISYIRNKMIHQKPGEAIYVLLDTTNAFASVESALQPLLLLLPENSIQEKSLELRNAFSAIAGDYELNQGFKSLGILQFMLEPAFRSWKVELKNTLEAYTPN